jgi:hypothetical protein
MDELKAGQEVWVRLKAAGRENTFYIWMRSPNWPNGPDIQCFRKDVLAGMAQASTTGGVTLTVEQVQESFKGITVCSLAVTNGYGWKILTDHLNAYERLNAHQPDEAEENLADYLLRNQPPTWDYAKVLGLARKVAQAEAGRPTAPEPHMATRIINEIEVETGEPLAAPAAPVSCGDFAADLSLNKPSYQRAPASQANESPSDFVLGRKLGAARKETP